MFNSCVIGFSNSFSFITVSKPYFSKFSFEENTYVNVSKKPLDIDRDLSLFFLIRSIDVLFSLLVSSIDKGFAFILSIPIILTISSVISAIFFISCLNRGTSTLILSGPLSLISNPRECRIFFIFAFSIF